MKLNMRHTFKMVRLVKISGIKDEIVKMISAQGEKDAEKIGIEIFNTLIEKAGNENLEKFVYDFFADVAEKTPDEIENMYLDEMQNLLKSIVEDNNLKVFFQKVAALVKKTSRI